MSKFAIPQVLWDGIIKSKSYKIDFEVVDGKFNLQQKEWIKTTKPIQIIIGTLNLKQVEVESHKTLKVINIDQDNPALTALIGKIEVEGSVETVNHNTERGTITKLI